jgi:hypothetical protein
MRFPKVANPAAFALAITFAAPLFVGCAAPEEGSNAPVESTGKVSQAIEPLAAVSGGFGILSGLISAYNAIDNISRYGTTNGTGAILDAVKAQQATIDQLQKSQNEQFLQLGIDTTISPINTTDGKIAREWSAYESQGAAYVPKELLWSDLDDMVSRLVGANGTSSAFKLISDKMFATPDSSLKDPLGTFAVRMRLRLAQGTFLMTRTAAITPDQVRIYVNQVERLNESFAKATRGYFLKVVEPIEAQSGVSATCASRIVFTPYKQTASYAFTSENGAKESQAFDLQSDCETARVAFQTQTVATKRAEAVNKIWLEQENFVNWKKRTGTIAVLSATYQNKDVTKAVSLMCYTVETSSFVASSMAKRLGSDPTLPAGTLDVNYLCVGDDPSEDRWSTAEPGKDGVLTCNRLRALSGDYVNTSRDGTGQRLPEDAATIAPSADTAGLLTWKDKGAVNDGYVFTIQNDLLNADWRSSDWVNYTRMTVEWGDEGLPRRILGPNGQWFTYLSPPKAAVDASAYEGLVPSSL